MSQQPAAVSEQLDAAAVFPAGAGSAAVQLLDVRAPVEVDRCEIPSAISRPILTDEERHGEEALQHGGEEFPRPVKDAMTLASQLMTKNIKTPCVFLYFPAS